jgi:hypothetical protein
MSTVGKQRVAPGYGKTRWCVCIQLAVLGTGVTLGFFTGVPGPRQVAVAIGAKIDRHIDREDLETQSRRASGE